MQTQKAKNYVRRIFLKINFHYEEEKKHISKMAGRRWRGLTVSRWSDAREVLRLGCLFFPAGARAAIAQHIGHASGGWAV